MRGINKPCDESRTRYVYNRIYISQADINKVRTSISKLEAFLAVQELFMTETAKLAHVVLPTVVTSQKDGTFTNAERKYGGYAGYTVAGGTKSDWRYYLFNRHGNGIPYEL
ncbi:MAG: molybdopterin-dependent oxidoreductase [Planctomycetia bacterium]|nr:molybdopterin-dependent oxidoreductase [Planctomycetia bacterium]